jgi:catechol 2,3-dioxygenase-like lactoylglutathione lyase family enzyme
MTNNNAPIALAQSLGQVSRTVRSLVESIEFYENKLGIPHLYSFGNLGFLDMSGSRLFLHETDKVNKDESILYFKVADIVEACATLQVLGVDISNQPHLIHTHEDGREEWMAFVQDPEGRPIGLMSTTK